MRTQGHTQFKPERAGEADIAEIVACLARNHSRYQFAPVWTEAMLRGAPSAAGRA